MAEDIPIIAPNWEVKDAQYKFDGSWYGASEHDPSEIGPNNFKTLTNMRYAAGHPEGVSGYTVLNETPIDTYTDMKAGVQLLANRDTLSRVIVAGSDGSSVRLFQSTDAIPGAVTFDAITTGRSGGGAGSEFDDTTGNDPRLSILPQRNVGYANQEISYIYGGNQLDCVAFFLCDDTSLTNPRDYWEVVKNSLATDTVTIDSATTDVFTVHSTRPLQGVWIEVVTPNATTSTLTGHVWTASGWVALGNPTDGTDIGGVSMAQSGEFIFDSTVASAARKHFESTYFFCYRFQLSAGSAVVSHVQVDPAFQPMVDIWDGVPRNAIYAGINYGDANEDFTAHVIESSTTAVPIGMLLDGLRSSDEVYVIFEERTTALQITMLSNLVNDVTATIAVAYWNGSTWANVSNLVDTTLKSGKTFKRSGLISWTPPNKTLEFPYTLGKVTGWAYRLSPSATLTGTHGDATDSVVVDVLTGIPAPQTVLPYKFMSQFKGRTLGCGAVSEKEGNRIDFTAPYAPDVWNGFMSSNMNTQSVYLGTDEDINCGESLYNRYGSVDRLFEVWVGFSDSHIYQIKESEADDQIYDYDTISSMIGCPAPRTLTSANIGFDTSGDGAKRNILLWIDSSGPYSYDGSSPDPIPGIEKYFDPNDSLYVGSDLSSAHAWFDSIYREWNLVLPGDVWVVFDLERKRWFVKDTDTAYTPQVGFQAVDTTGAKYSYGLLESGEIVRLEYGTTYDGVAILQELKTGDFWPSENIWHITRIRYLKLAAIAIAEDHNVEILVEIDTKPAASGTFIEMGEFTEMGEFIELGPTVATMSLQVLDGNRITRKTIRRNDLGWCFSVGFKVYTSNTSKGFQPIGWGIEYEIERMDI